MYTSDNGNETFTNPIMLADYADVDIIRVENYFYMVSSSMNRIPGMAVCRSQDLINWEIIGYVYTRLEINEKYDMKNGNVYRGGPWAPAIRYNRFTKKFMVCATSNADDEGFIMFTADQPEGPYDVTALGGWLFDPGLLIDDDGRVYVYFGRDEIQIVELSADGKSFLSKPKLAYKNVYKDVLEGTHAYHVNGYYYLSSTICGRAGKQMIMRSKNVDGPFEGKVVMNAGTNLDGAYIHQGGIVDTPQGKWWFFMFQDRDYVGRCPVIEPLTWVDGWPIPGDPLNGFRPVSTWEKPVKGVKAFAQGIERSDEFEGGKIGLNWQWNHNADDSKWSLTERKSWLRLYTSKANDVFSARNTLTQKIVGPDCTGTAKFDISNMKDGDVAGQVMWNFDRPYSYLAVYARNGQKDLVMMRNDRIIATIPNITSDVIYFRSEVTKHANAMQFYSFDNETFTQLGDQIDMQFTMATFLGYSFGLFNYATKSEGGYVDIDWFHLDSKTNCANHFSAFDQIDAYRYDDCHDIKTERCCKYHFGDNVCVPFRGSHIRFDHIDFGKGATWFEASVATGGNGGTIEIYLDKIYGKLIGSVDVEHTDSDGWQYWKTVNCDVEKVTGVHTVYLRFANKQEKDSLFNLDWFQFHQ